MRTARFSDAQIMRILKQAESDVPAAELFRGHGMSSAGF
jgi:putative transposase